jgi:hypothetical protein
MAGGGVAGSRVRAAGCLWTTSAIPPVSVIIWNAGLVQTQAPFFGCGPAHFNLGGLGVVHVRFLCENTGFDS